MARQYRADDPAASRSDDGTADVTDGWCTNGAECARNGTRSTGNTATNRANDGWCTTPPAGSVMENQELEALDQLVTSDGWRLFREMVSKDWGPQGSRFIE